MNPETTTPAINNYPNQITDQTTEFLPFEHTPGNEWKLKKGTEVKLVCNHKFNGRIAVVTQSPLRFGQKRLHMKVEGELAGYMIPVSWVHSFRHYQSGTNQKMDAQDTKTDTIWKPSPMPGESVKFGNMVQETKIGDVVVFHRGGKSFDVARIEYWKTSRVYCKDLASGRILGYKPEWYVGKLDQVSQERFSKKE